MLLGLLALKTFLRQRDSACFVYTPELLSMFSPIALVFVKEGSVLREYMLPCCGCAGVLPRFRLPK